MCMCTRARSPAALWTRRFQVVTRMCAPHYATHLASFSIEFAAVNILFAAPTDTSESCLLLSPWPSLSTQQVCFDITGIPIAFRASLVAMDVKNLCGHFISIWGCICFVGRAIASSSHPDPPDVSVLSPGSFESSRALPGRFGPSLMRPDALGVPISALVLSPSS
ncbi:hypothetical protein J3R82DRAFT_12049 [Butyriboletus roseoflavus]|nr:hypothetical protein J3R82DRAFT_12049 [Butyriboletus roseoflavus]